MRGQAEGEIKTEAILRIIICICMILVMGFLTMVSILHTTNVADDETITYYNDNFILNLIVTGIFIAICFIILPVLKKVPLWAEIIFISLWTIILGLLWVYSSQASVAWDSGSVNNAALKAAENDFSFLEERYFKDYSFQLGYVFFYEIIIRIASLFGEVTNFLFLEVGNVLFLTASYIAIILMNQRIFNNSQIQHLTVLILAFGIQPIIFSSFLYGIIPGLAFALYAVYFEIIYLQDSKLQYGLLSAVFITIAIMIKSNYNIVMIAMMLFVLAKLFRRKQFIWDVLYIIVTVVFAFSVSPVVKNMYEHRSGIDLGDSIPYVCWISMGMNESWNAPGWYNYGFTVAAFENAGYDAEIASENAMRTIKERLKYFSEDAQYKQDFFYKKAVSQWNETSYESICLNKSMGSYSERKKIASWVLNNGEQKVKQFMDYYAQFIYVAVFIGAFICFRRKNLEQSIFLLIILGGFLYHLMSEAKSQYSMPYFICMMGFAPCGILCVCEFLKKKLEPVQQKFKIIYKYKNIVTMLVKKSNT
ncbi:MAG: glycosyltransferase family 39 protein [Ruminococcus sp.]|nr:glycosyltransferase family 39 protein [Ruminococcus sp.]